MQGKTDDLFSWVKPIKGAMSTNAKWHIIIEK